MKKHASLVVILLSWVGIFAFAAQQGSDTVYITKTGKKYHRDGCRFLDKTPTPISLAEASKRFTPCSVCKPPILKGGIEKEKKPKDKLKKEITKKVEEPAKKVEEPAKKVEVVVQAPPPNRNTRFGLPSPAKANTFQREDYLLEHPQYVLSYNTKTRTPNWVCWELKPSDLGKAERNRFIPDPDLPAVFARVTETPYKSSGFDKGHLCPSADRADTEENNDPTFYMSNIIPQAPNVNRKTWANLEKYCRTLAKKGHVLHIAAGPHGKGGTGEKGPAEEIGKGTVPVTVPAKCWKVVLVLPSEDAEPRKNTRAIAVIVPNSQGVATDWSIYRVSVSEVEKLTGYTFFSTIPAETRQAIIKDVDDVKIATSKK